jgi:hypothetical protein
VLTFMLRHRCFAAYCRDHQLGQSGFHVPPFATGKWSPPNFGMTWPATISERAMSINVSSTGRKDMPRSLAACASCAVTDSADLCHRSSIL